MTIAPNILLRLQFLTRVIRKESDHLTTTDQRLFKTPFTLEKAQQLDTNIELAEQVDAFVSRFGRLQDTLGDKLLPSLLTALGEKTQSVVENLDRAERLGLIKSTDEWLTTRTLRNQMVHEYVEDLTILSKALQTAHCFVPILTETANKMLKAIESKGLF